MQRRCCQEGLDAIAKCALQCVRCRRRADRPALASTVKNPISCDKEWGRELRRAYASNATASGSCLPTGTYLTDCSKSQRRRVDHAALLIARARGTHHGSPFDPRALRARAAKSQSLEQTPWRWARRRGAKVRTELARLPTGIPCRVFRHLVTACRNFHNIWHSAFSKRCAATHFSRRRLVETGVVCMSSR